MLQKQLKKTGLLALMLISGVQISNAQKHGKNLLLDGGFEKVEIYATSNSNPFSYWENLYPKDVYIRENYKDGETAHRGTYCLVNDPSSRALFLVHGGKQNWDPNVGTAHIIKVKEGKEYVAFYWYKKDYFIPDKDSYLHFRWFDTNGKELPSTYVKKKTEWDPHKDKWFKTEEVTVKAPQGAETLSFMLEIGARVNSGTTMIDDVFFGLKVGSGDDIEDPEEEDPGAEKPQEPQVETPKEFKVAHTYQREVELEWSPISGGSNITYQVEIDNKKLTTKESKLTVTGLKPDTSYTAKVSAISGNKHSDPNTLKVKTEKMSKTETDPERLPYLRTLIKSGSKELDLFFSDLATDNPQISYFIDGHRVTPTNNKLTFEGKPNNEKTKLVITIEEAQDRKWVLQYFLNINN